MSVHAIRSHRLLRDVAWPVIVVGSAAAFAISFARGAADASLVLVPLAAFVPLLLLELLAPERQGAGAFSDPQKWNDAAHGIVGQGGGNTLGQVTFVFAAAALAGEISARFGANLWPSQWPLWAQVTLSLFVADGLDYWRHRLSHQLAWLWPLHALHHSVDRMNVMKSSRGHFLDMLFRNLAVYAPLALIGVPRDVLLAYAAAVTVFGPIAHTNVAVRLPSFLHRLVLTPQVHRIHHARPLALSCSNYANVFPLWDILFGSFHHPNDVPGFEYGIEDDDTPGDFLGQTLDPFAKWRDLQTTSPGAKPSESGLLQGG